MSSIDRTLFARQARAEMVRVLYRHAVPGFTVALASAAILLFVLWPESGHSAALGWFGAILVTSMIRWAVFVAYWRAKPQGTDALAWELPFLVAILLSSAVWGFGVVWIMPKDSLTMQLFCVVFLMGIAGGALSAYSSVRQVGILTELVVLGPMIGWLFASGGFVHVVLGAILTITLGALLRAIKDISETLFGSLSAGYEIEVANELAQRRSEKLRRANLRLQDGERRFRRIAEKAADAIWVLDVKTRRVSYVSPAVERLLGYTQEQAMALPAASLLTRASLRRLARRVVEIRSCLAKGGDLSTISPSFECDLLHKDGHLVNVEATVADEVDGEGAYATVVAITRDISRRVRETESLHRLAFFDPLTELPNRRLLIDRLQQSLAKARRIPSRVTLLFIDVDKFKEVNDEHGHQAGDRVLRTLAERLSRCIRESDTAARIAGDEFVVLLLDAGTEAGEARVAESIRASVEQPLELADGTRLAVSCSVGIAAYPDHADNEWELLSIGDQLMYKAKRQGGNRVVFADDRQASRSSPWVENAGLVRLVWSDAYTSGHPVIDAEHQELLSLANRLMDAARVKAGDFDGFLDAFDALLGHANRHFAHEEAVLRESCYPYAREHAALHARLLERSTELRRRAEAKDISGAELVDFLVIEVVSRHILNADSRFFPHLAAGYGSASPIDRPADA